MNSDSNNKTQENPVGFSPADLSDGREKGNWETRYPEEARKIIIKEFFYLILIFISSILLPLFVLIWLKLYENTLPFNADNIKKFFFGGTGGCFGGCVFSAKWLIHSVAKDTWNVDRWLWRVLTPIQSAGLAFITILLVNSQILSFVKPNELGIQYCYALGFLVGYFSDNAIGKMTEVAQVFFGSSMGKR